MARALDYAKQIKKTPIVVNDSRGFFTSRVIGNFVNEALAFLTEGVHPITIEQATTQAGYPVGALQLTDELNMELMVKIRNETRDAVEAAGGVYSAHPGERVIDTMIKLGRQGRLRGKGFFDYDEAGKRTQLWDGLLAEFPVKGKPGDVDLEELQERMLFAEAVDAARCLEEGVLTSVADANIGSIMGIGFPPWTGGVLQYINGYSGPGGAGAEGLRRASRRVRRQVRRALRPGPAATQEGSDRGEVRVALRRSFVERSAGRRAVSFEVTTRRGSAHSTYRPAGLATQPARSVQPGRPRRRAEAISRSTSSG